MLPIGNNKSIPWGHFAQFTAPYHGGMDMAKMRMDRLRALIADRFDGNQSTFASAVGKMPNYISRLLKGSKRMGEDFAREVETILKLPPRYLDGLSEIKPATGPLDSMADRLVFLRESRELTRENLAQAASVPLEFIEAIENGVTEGLALQPYLRLCDFFKCNPQWLAHGPQRAAPVPPVDDSAGKRTSGTSKQGVRRLP
jgi:DNA-binding XRE family transcriptional regulator